MRYMYIFYITCIIFHARFELVYGWNTILWPADHIITMDCEDYIMNMKLNRNCLMLCMVIWMGGCSLDKAPDCIPGHEMCDSDDLTGNSILYVCDQNKKWLSVQSCLQCNNNTCSNTDPSWNCDAEGELTCSDIDSSGVFDITVIEHDVSFSV